MTIETIKKHQPCDVYLSSYTAGKEELFIEIAKHFKTQVWVAEDRFKDMEILGFSKYFTLDESIAWIFLNRFVFDEDGDEKENQ